MKESVRIKGRPEVNDDQVVNEGLEEVAQDQEERRLELELREKQEEEFLADNKWEFWDDFGYIGYRDEDDDVYEEKPNLFGLDELVNRDLAQIQCLRGHVFLASVGSDLEQRENERYAGGFLDALCVTSDECPVCQAERRQLLDWYGVAAEDQIYA